MKLLLSYLKRYKSYVFLTLVLATINQVFSMLDPYIMGILIQKYGVDAAKIPENEYYRGVFLGLGAVVGVALVSRVAKNFQDYFTNFEVESLGRAKEAMARLLTRARSQAADPELFAGLVLACRFCGLLDASLAADRQAKRLDPHIRTSVMYTNFMRGDWERAIESDNEDLEMGHELDASDPRTCRRGDRQLSPNYAAAAAARDRSDDGRRAGSARGQPRGSARDDP